MSDKKTKHLNSGKPKQSSLLILFTTAKRPVEDFLNGTLSKQLAEFIY